MDKMKFLAIKYAFILHIVKVIFLSYFRKKQNYDSDARISLKACIKAAYVCENKHELKWVVYSTYLLFAIISIFKHYVKQNNT